MSKQYWEKPKSNNCPQKPIIDNKNHNGGAIVVGRQFSDGLNEQERLKLAEIEHNAQVNIIETIEVNSEKQLPDENKVVNIFVPTKISQLENDKNFINEITFEQIKAAIGDQVAYITDFTITEEQWSTLNWENEVVEPEIPSEEPEVEEEDN
jgi:hypothetical protein